MRKPSKITALTLIAALSNLWFGSYGYAANTQRPDDKQQTVTKSDEGADGRYMMMPQIQSGSRFNVDVLGEVLQPGTYRLSPSQKVLEAIDFAKGFTEAGSERNVELRRRGKTIYLDLYDLRKRGVLANNPFLQEGDVVFIPVRQSAISVQGPVRTPGQYETKGSTSLYDVIFKFGNGFTPGVAVDQPIRVIRYDRTDKKLVIEVPAQEDKLKGMQVVNGDIIIASHKFTSRQQLDYTPRLLPNDNFSYPAYDDQMYVIGGVRNPGKFSFIPRYTIMNYVTLAGGVDRLGHEDNITIFSTMGQKRAVTNLQDPLVLNPGETIHIRESKLPPEFWITFMISLASLGLSAVAILR